METLPATLAFERYRLDPQRRVLLCDGTPVALPDKAFSLLHALVSRRGEIVTKDALIEQVWGKPVSDANLSQHIFMLRTALKERSSDRRYIVNSSGKGYQFVAPVREFSDAEKHTFLNEDAYRAWVRGRYYLERRSERSLGLALDAFERAAALEPTSARAHIGIAMAYCCLGSYEYRAPKASFDRARSSAVRALEIDPAMAEAESMLGAIHLFYDWDFSKADDLIKSSLLKNPSDTDTLNARTWLSMACCNLDEARKHAESAVLVDPSALHLQATLGLAYQRAGQPERAVKHFESLLEMDDGFHLARSYLGLALLEVGEVWTGVSELERVVNDDRNVRSVASLAYAYALAGRTPNAELLYDELQSAAARGYVSPYRLAIPLVGMRRFDEAFAHLSQGYAERATGIIFLATEPRFEPLRAMPEYARLIVG